MLKKLVNTNAYGTDAKISTKNGVLSCISQKFFHAGRFRNTSLPITSKISKNSVKISSNSHNWYGNPTIARKKNIVKKLYTLHMKIITLQVFWNPV
jgi:hypothetical protein